MAVENYIRGVIPQRRIARRRARAAEREMMERVNATISRIARTPPGTMHQENRGPVKLLDNHDAIVAELQKRNNNQQTQIADLVKQVENQRTTIEALKRFIQILDDYPLPLKNYIQKLQDILSGKTLSIENFEVVADQRINETPLDQSAMHVDFEGPYSSEEAKKIITEDTTDVDSQEN